MIERRIKELAIAMEALSRINGYDATVLLSKVSELLADAIAEAREAPIKPSVKPSLDDDIPF